jgi:NAD(P)-dependent dehydrogenase (short-subunit alcohol dehydrogenase family)
MIDFFADKAAFDRAVQEALKPLNDELNATKQNRDTILAEKKRLEGKAIRTQLAAMTLTERKRLRANNELPQEEDASKPFTKVNVIGSFRLQGIVERLLSEIGMIDILVSAATGGKRAFGLFVEMEMDGFKGSFDKLWGYANVVRFGARHVSDGGSITLLSGSPARTFPKGLSALSSVGGAVEAFVRTVRRKLPLVFG